MNSSDSQSIVPGPVAIALFKKVLEMNILEP